MTLHQALESRGAPLRRSRALGSFLPALLIAVVALAAGAWLIRSGWGSAATWVVAVWTVIAGAMVLGGLAFRRSLFSTEASNVALLLEEHGDWRRGALTTLLAPVVSGTSSSLHEYARDSEANLILQVGSNVLAPEVAREHALIRKRASFLVIGLVGLLLAKPVSGPAAMLWQPWRAIGAFTAPISLNSDRLVVDRGESVRLTIEAFGQQHVTLSLRAPGQPWRDQDILLDEAGRADFTTGPLDAEIVARASAGGRNSEEVRVTIRMPAFLAAFTVTAHYPGYLSLEDEVLPIGADTLIIPEGTRLSLSGRATTALGSVVVQWPSDSNVMSVDGETFSGELTPTSTARYSVAITPEQGGSLEGSTPEMMVRVVADTAPVVTLPVPGQDTTAPASHRLPVVVAIEDDHGISGVVMETRTNSSPQLSRLVIPMAGGVSDRALLSIALDLDSLGLGPGDTLHYGAIATDNAPRPRAGRSPVYQVVVPTKVEERAAQNEATSQAGHNLDSLAALARRAQRQTDELARERQRTDQTSAAANPDNPDPLSAESARKSEQAAESQDAIDKQMEQMKRELSELQQVAEQNEIPDPELARQLADIRQLLDEAMSPELKKAMEELRKGLQNLDASKTRDALESLAEQQKKMRDAIERAKELFERAKSETELANLAEEARDLAQQQKDVTQQLADDPAGAAAHEDNLADRADSLAAALEDAANRALAQQTEQGLQQAANKSRQAASQMRNASKAAKSGKQNQAQQQAEAAGEFLDPLEEQIRAERKEMQEEMKREVLAALDRLLQETTNTLEQQQDVAESLRRGAIAVRIRAEETMLDEGTAKLLQQVIAVAGKNALISPTIAVALAGARDGMRQAVEAVSSAAPSLGLASDKAGDAVDMLAVAVYALLRSQQSVSESESASGLEEAMQQMQQMAGQQGELSDQGKSMLQQGEPGMSELLKLAVQQRALAQQLERMKAGGEMPGASELAQEAKDLARDLELGRLTPETIARQERLFRRMLDAGRSLQGEESDDKKERKSEAAGEIDPSRPDLLDPSLLRGAEFPLPSWEELQRLSPDDRRRVMDYFRRLAERRQP